MWCPAACACCILVPTTTAISWVHSSTACMLPPYPLTPASLLIIIIIYNLHCTHKPFNQHCQKLSFFPAILHKFCRYLQQKLHKRDRRAFTELIHVKIILHNKLMIKWECSLFYILGIYSVAGENIWIIWTPTLLQDLISGGAKVFKCLQIGNIYKRFFSALVIWIDKIADKLNSVAHVYVSTLK